MPQSPQTGQYSMADVDPITSGASQGQFSMADIDKPGVPPPPANDQFAQDTATTEGWAAGHPIAGPVARFLVSAGQSAANAIQQTPGFIYHAAIDESKPGEPADFGQRFASRVAGLPQAIESGQEYAAGHVSPAGAVSVLPEALGQGVGKVTGNAVYGKLAQAPSEINRAIPSSVRAGKGIGMIKRAIGGTEPVAPASVPAAQKIASDIAANTPGTAVPPAVQGIVDKAAIAANPQVAIQRGLTPQPLTFSSLHDSLHALNDALYVDKTIPAGLVPEVKTLAGTLADDLQNHANAQGVGQDWANNSAEYARGQGWIRGARKMGPVIGAAGGILANEVLPSVFPEARALGPVGDLVGAGIGARYAGGPAGSLAGSMVKSVIDRPFAGEPALPQLSNLQPPTAVPAPQAATPVQQPATSARPAPTPAAPATPPPTPAAAAPATTVPPPPTNIPTPPQAGTPAPGGLVSGPLPERFQPIQLAPEGEATPAPDNGRRVSEQPVANERRVGERRHDEAARARFEQMTPEQQYQAAYTNHVTGLPNARAYAEAGPAAAHGMSDVAGLKWLNDKFGSAAGDELLRAKANALQRAGVEAYHTGGDEFRTLGQNPVDLYERMNRANAILRETPIEVTTPEGVKEYYNGAEFRHGVGQNPAAAERAMMQAKAASKATRGTQGTLKRIPPPVESVQ